MPVFLLILMLLDPHGALLNAKVIGAATTQDKCYAAGVTSVMADAQDTADIESTGDTLRIVCVPASAGVPAPQITSKDIQKAQPKAGI